MAVFPTEIWLLRYRRPSLLSSAILVLLTVGIFTAVIELVCDLYISGVWRPGWSLIVLISCAGPLRAPARHQARALAEGRSAPALPLLTGLRPAAIALRAALTEGPRRGGF